MDEIASVASNRRAYDVIEARQKYPHELKVEMSKGRIREWYREFSGRVAVSYSGGKDSEVLLHLVRAIYPDVPAVFCNTGLEYPEIVEHVEATDNVHIIRPEKSFKRILDEYGYPVVSKVVAYQIRTLRNPHPGNENTRRLIWDGVKKDSSKVKQWGMKLAYKWRYLVDAPFDISEQCCDWLKKKPLHKYTKDNGRRFYIGTMAADSKARKSALANSKEGCNAYSKRHGTSKPLSFWTREDIDTYIDANDIPICKIYSMGYEHTGCIYCAFGAHLEKEPNRFQMLAMTHPQLHKYCMEKLGMREVLKYIGVASEPPYEQLELGGVL